MKHFYNLGTRETVDRFAERSNVHPSTSEWETARPAELPKIVMPMI